MFVLIIAGIFSIINYQSAQYFPDTPSKSIDLLYDCRHWPICLDGCLYEERELGGRVAAG
jgi:hypothetical protein